MSSETRSGGGANEAPGTDAPEVTVVIPTRNRWPMLRHTLAGALGQEDVDLEVVVVDDGSSDETPRRLAELADERLRVLRQETTEGVARARNRGIAAARGDWVAFLDDDDLWSPRKLREQLDAARDVDARFVYSAAIIVDATGTPIRAVPAPRPEDMLRLLLLRYVMPGGASNAIAEARLVRSLGGFDEQLFVLADWDLWIRLAAAGRVSACPEALVAYREHAANMTVGEDRDVFAEFEHLAAKHRQLGRREGVSFDRISFLGWVVREHRRAGRRLKAANVYLRRARLSRSVGDVVRAIAVLFGERAMAAGQRVLHRIQPPAVEPRPPPPLWLDQYRVGAT